MARRKWYERVSAVALIAMLTMNSSEMGLRTLADMIPVSADDLVLNNEDMPTLKSTDGNAVKKPLDSDETDESEEESGALDEDAKESENEGGEDGDAVITVATASSAVKAPEIAAYEVTDTVPTYTITYESVEGRAYKVFMVEGTTFEKTMLYNNPDALHAIIEDCKSHHNSRGEIDLEIEDPTDPVATGYNFNIKDDCIINLYGNYNSGTLFTIMSDNIDVTINSYANISAGYVYQYEKDTSHQDTSKVTFNNCNSQEINAEIVVGKNDVVDLRGADITKAGSDALNIYGTYTMESGTITGRVALKYGAVFTMEDGTINGDISGNAGSKFVMNGGTVNGAVGHVGNIEINNGSISNIEDKKGYVYTIYPEENSRISINGGKIYAENQYQDPAFAILMVKNVELTLAGSVDISAKAPDGKPSASIYYDAIPKTIDAVNVTGFSKKFIIATDSSGMSGISPFTNWIKGTEENIETIIKNNTEFKVFSSIWSIGSGTAYDAYKPVVYKNYIRMLDPDQPSVEITNGDITEVTVMPSATDTDKVDVEYKVSTETAEETKEINDVSKNDLSGILSAILDADTSAGYKLTIGSESTPFTGDVTVDTGTNGITIELYGQIEGRCNIIGTGTLKSYVNAQGIDGTTDSTIRLLGGQIISTSENAIYLSAANLYVEAGAEVKDSSASGSGKYAIKAAGPVSVTINGGTVCSENNTAIDLYRLSNGSEFARLNMTEGSVSGGSYGLRQSTSGTTNISGGTISGTSGDIYFESGDKGRDGTFTVIGEIPFEKVDFNLVMATSYPDIDFTKTKIGNGKKLKLTISKNATVDTTLKLFELSKANYRDILQNTELQISGFTPIFVIDNKSVEAESADVYVYWSNASNNPRRVRYYKAVGDTEPLYEEYLVNGSILSSVSIVIDGKTPDGWKTADGNRVTSDMAVNKYLDLYAAYNVALTGTVSDADITHNSAVIKGSTEGSTVYGMPADKYDPGKTAAEIVAAGESAESGVAAAVIDSDGTYSLELTGLAPGKDYTYYLAAKSAAGDYSNVLPVTFTTKERQLTAADFRCVGELSHTYDGKTYPETFGILPTDENQANKCFEIAGIKFALKDENGNYSSTLTSERPKNAGTYGVYVTTQNEASGIAKATDLYIVDITIEKADVQNYWFTIPKSITYGNDSDDVLKPKIAANYQGYITEADCGTISYTLYYLSNYTRPLSRNEEGHYDATGDVGMSYDTYHMGITCTGSANVNATTEIVRLGDINFYRANNTITELTCADIRYGGTPSPQIKATDVSKGVTYTYSQTPDDTGSFKPWSDTNTAGTWYVKAKVNKTLNYTEVTSDPVEFTVEKSQLVPEVASLQSKEYDGGTTAVGTLKLTAAAGSHIPTNDDYSINAPDAVTGNFAWTSKDAGTKTVDVTEIALKDSFTTNYELSTSALLGVSCGDAQITNAQIGNVTAVPNRTLTYNKNSQRVDVTTTGITVDNSPVTFTYAETEEGLETSPQTEVPAFTDAGTYVVHYKASAPNHDSVTGTFEVVINNSEITDNDVSVTGYNGVYDGQTHAITVQLSGDAEEGTIRYRDADGNYTLAECPEYANVGNYTVAFEISKANYDPYYGNALIAITPAQLSVTAEPEAVTYKDNAPAYRYTVTGFVNGETEETALEGNIVFDCAYTAGSDAGVYDIIPSGFTAKNGNYEICYQNSKLTVEQAEATFAVDNLEELNRVYDAKAIAPKASTDSDGKLTVTVIKGTELLEGDPVNAGTYTVVVSGEAGRNYKAGQASYSFEIKRAQLLVTALDQKVISGEGIPEYTVTYDGFAGDENEKVLGGKLQMDCEYTPRSQAGTYAIIPSGLISENYEIQFINGTLLVEYRSSSDDDGSSGEPGSTKVSTSKPKDSGNESGSWSKTEKGWRYDYKNGSYAAGKMVTDVNGNTHEDLAWVKVKETWWAFGADGYLKTGWVQDGTDGRWYQIDENRGMRTGWYFGESDDQKWYYLDPESGAMIVGWRVINGKWYYFTADGLKVEGHPYGSMYWNERTPDGYSVGKDGDWDGREAKVK